MLTFIVCILSRSKHARVVLVAAVQRARDSMHTKITDAIIAVAPVSLPLALLAQRQWYAVVSCFMHCCAVVVEFDDAASQHCNAAL